jgi:leucyl aminopeptidase (aminopeptidase T)
MKIKERLLAKIILEHCFNLKGGDFLVVSFPKEVSSFVNTLNEEAFYRNIKIINQSKSSNTLKLEKDILNLLPLIKQHKKYLHIRTFFVHENKKISKIKGDIYKKLNKTLSNKHISSCTLTLFFKKYKIDKTTYAACFLDWDKIQKKLIILQSKFKKRSKLHLIGEGINLSFFVKKKSIGIDFGKKNMPGGELFMLPIQKSINGYIKFDSSLFFNGRQIGGILLTFKDGKLIDYHSDIKKELIYFFKQNPKIFIGEFGIGFNPKIPKIMGDMFYDEKISGTIHLALCGLDKKNIPFHKDLIKDMHFGKIILDKKIIQKRGIWKI